MYKYLDILESGTIKQAEVKGKGRKELIQINEKATCIQPLL